MGRVCRSKWSWRKEAGGGMTNTPRRRRDEETGEERKGDQATIAILE